MNERLVILYWNRDPLIWHTDESKMAQEVGVGMYGTKCSITEALGATPTIV